MFSKVKLWQLRSKLQDPQGEVREQAVQAIREVGTDAAVQMLIECLAMRSDGHVLPAASMALVEIGTPEALDGLLAAMHGENREGLHHIAEALSEYKDPRVIPGLLLALTRDIPWNPTSAKRAIDLLKQYADPNIKAGLREAVRHNSSQVRWHVIDALGALHDSDAVDVLVGVLSDDSLSSAAAHALQLIRSPRAIPGLLQAIRNRPLEQRAPMLETLVSLGWKPTTAEDHVIKALALGKYGDIAAHGPAALPYIIPELRRGDPVEAIHAINKIGDARVVPELIEFCRQDPQHAAEICRTLGKLKDPRAIPLLIEILSHPESDPDGSHRAAAAWAVGHIGDAQAAPALLAAMRTRHDNVLAPTAEALGKLHEPKAVPLLIAALAHKPCVDRHLCWKVRYFAAEALGKLGDPHAVKPLLLALKHDDWYELRKSPGSLVAESQRVLREETHAHEVDQAIAVALARLHHPQTVDALHSMLHGESTPWGVVAALERQEDPKALAILRTIVEGPYGHLKCRAAQALARRHDPLGAEFLLQALAPVADEWSEGRTSISPEVEYAARYLGELAEPLAVGPLLQSLQDLKGPSRQTLRAALHAIVEKSPQSIDEASLTAIESTMQREDDSLARLARAELQRRHASAEPSNVASSPDASSNPAVHSDEEIHVTCVCGKHYHVKREFAGRRMKCGHCGQSVVVPASSSS